MYECMIQHLGSTIQKVHKGSVCCTRAPSVNPHMAGEKSEQVPWAAVTALMAMMISSLPAPLLLLFEIGFHVPQTGLELTM